MSFAYKPLPFDDLTAFNRVGLTPNSIKFSCTEIALQLANVLPQGLILLDGYPTARFQQLIDALQKTVPGGLQAINVSSLHQPQEKIQDLLINYLPEDRSIDPDLIFGKLYDQDYLPIFDGEKVNHFLNDLPNKKHVILYGHGSSCKLFRPFAKKIIYIDVTPKDAALRVFDGLYKSLGFPDEQNLDAAVRQIYFIDIELAVRLRKELIQNDLVDNYLLDSELSISMMRSEILKEIFDQLKIRPLRAKPVYIEGVWGGQFIKRYRGIPDNLAENVAWSFELIPTEASLLVESNGNLIDIPFLTVMNGIGKSIMGENLYKQFNGSFPIRFNFDDTWHSNGNMSIQCHPNDEMARELYGDFAGQNEAYYIVLTGHHAKTYCGFKKDGKAFLELCKQSEKNGTPVPYAEYVNAIPSSVGRQFLLPAGTIHSSGKNQLVLELGTLTYSAYTYKLYDYLRPDITGKPRPLHTKMAERALVFERNVAWVNENIAFPPKFFSEGKGWQEYLIGAYESICFVTHRVEMETGSMYCGENEDGFTVITIVDGEKATIQSADNPDFSYNAKYLDVILVPACIRNYQVIAKGKQPVILHKAFVRKNLV